MKYRIEFADDLMTVLDENGRDAHIVRAGGRDDFERQLDTWCRGNQFNIGGVNRELRHLLRAM